MSATPTAPGHLDVQMSRRGPLFAVVWLFFLIEPLRAGWAARDTAGGLLGVGLTVVFAVVYMAGWVQLRGSRQRLMIRPDLPVALTWLGGLVALGVGMTLTLGQVGTTSAVYVAVLSVMLFPFRLSLVLVVVNAVLAIVLGEVLPGWSSNFGLAFAICAASLAVFGIQQMMLRNLALVSAQNRNSELAVENERNRFARDLHDILGHSLTVITVKAELAKKLMDVDPARARAEIDDLERLSRDALADVRRAVEGYRELSLAGELVRARTALAAAEIEAVLPNSVEEVPSDRRELFAWTIREGVTNVIRHSGASRCTVVLTPESVEVRDDGTGDEHEGHVGHVGHDDRGHGLTGLRERASAQDGTVVTRTLEPGFSLSMVLR